MAKIMLVDDAAFMRMFLTNVVTKLGHTVVGEVDNGKKAVECYSSINPDIVFMDITMPEMNGIQAVKGIKELDPKAKIIMCSAMGSEHMLKEAILAGAKDFISKPFKNEDIEKVINATIS